MELLTITINELKWDMIVVDIGGIVDHHSMSWGERWFLLILVELLTVTQWVEVRGDFCWYWFLLKWLTITQCIEVRGDFCWYWWNCWPSLNVLRWEVIFVDIGGIVDVTQWVGGERWFLLILVEFWPSLNELRWDGIVDHHLMSCGEWWLFLILVELLTITQWVMVRGDFVDIGGIVDHHSIYRGERWFLLILVELLTLILVKLLTITQCIEVRGDFCWYWWNCWPSFNEFRWEVIFVDIGGIVDHHSMSWSERWFLLILV